MSLSGWRHSTHGLPVAALARGAKQCRREMRH
jgi:hypothetical protein